MLNMGELFRFPRIPSVEMARVTAPTAAPERAFLAVRDLMFARRSLTLEGAGRCSIVLDVPEPTTWESSIIRARVDESRAHAPFLFYYFASAQGRRSMETIVEQVAAAGIRITDLARLSVPAPPIDEQRSIAEVLGALDDKIAANTRLAQKAFTLVATLFAEALARGVETFIPLRSVATVVLGGTPSRARSEYWTDGTVPWLNSGKANDDRILTPSEYITEQAVAGSATKLMPVGATVVAITGATLGQVARLELSAAGNQSLVGIWSEDTGLNDWLHFAVRQQIPVLLTRATGAAQQHVSKGDVESLEVPILDAAELSEFARKATPLLQLAAKADQENLTLAATRDALLPQLMSGKLRVRDAQEAVEEVA